MVWFTQVGRPLQSFSSDPTRELHVCLYNAPPGPRSISFMRPGPPTNWKPWLQIRPLPKKVVDSTDKTSTQNCNETYCLFSLSSLGKREERRNHSSTRSPANKHWTSRRPSRPLRIKKKRQAPSTVCMVSLKRNNGGSSARTIR